MAAKKQKTDSTTRVTNALSFNLPQKDENGVPYISYSQISSWNDKKSFNLGIEGKLEYMLHYFMGIDFPDMGWGEFGQDVEDAILTQDFSKFSEEETNTLKKVEVLPVSQYKVYVNFYDEEGSSLLFYVYGLIDNASEDLSYIKDFKTASANSKAKYYTKDGYKQLDLYAMGILEKTGVLPTKILVDIIERSGNAFKGGRAVLKVGNETWQVDREIPTEDEMVELRKYVLRTATEVASYKDVFDLINV